MRSTILRGAFAAALAAAILPSAAMAQSPARTVAGTLECNVSGGVGFVFGSSRTLACTFNRSGAKAEHYVGKISRFGVDIGVTGKSVIMWQVLASAKPGPHALAGSYGGVGAEATAGAGLGANAMVGGSNKSFALQPVNVQAQTGLNVAAGIAEITLEPAG